MKNLYQITKTIHGRYNNQNTDTDIKEYFINSGYNELLMDHIYMENIISGIRLTDITYKSDIKEILNDLTDEDIKNNEILDILLNEHGFEDNFEYNFVCIKPIYIPFKELITIKKLSKILGINVSKLDGPFGGSFKYYGLYTWDLGYVIPHSEYKKYEKIFITYDSSYIVLELRTRPDILPLNIGKKYFNDIKLTFL